MVTPAAANRLRILVAVEGSDVSERAAIAAHRLFGDDADYLLVNVAEPTHAAPEHGLDAVAEEAHIGHPETLSASGDVASTIVRAAHEHAVDVIVVGSHDRSWFSRLFDPSTSRHIVGASDLPVLVVK